MLRKVMILATMIGFVAIVTLLWRPTIGSARSGYAAATGQPCGVCHNDPGGGGPLTGQGAAFAAVPTHSNDPAGAWAQVDAAPTSTPAPTDTAVLPTPTATVDPSTPTATAIPATPTATVGPSDPTPTATAIPPTATPTATAVPPTPTPTSTVVPPTPPPPPAAPTSSPIEREGRHWELEGTLEAMNGNTWTASGVSFIVGPHTNIKGNPVVGAKVEAKGVTDQDGILVARKVEVKEARNRRNREHEREDD